MARRPDRYRSGVIPHIYVAPAAAAIAFYERAFGARELFRICHPDGRILHAELSIPGAVIMIGDPDGVLLVWAEDLSPDEIERRGKTALD